MFFNSSDQKKNFFMLRKLLINFLKDGMGGGGGGVLLYHVHVPAKPHGITQTDGLKMAASFKSSVNNFTQMCSFCRKALPRYSTFRLLSCDSQANEKSSHFGYERVTEEEKTQKGRNTK